MKTLSFYKRTASGGNTVLKNFAVFFLSAYLCASPQNAAADMRQRLTFGSGTASVFYASEGLDATYEAFFGFPRTNRTNEPSTLGDENLSLGEDVDVQLNKSREIFVRKTWENNSWLGLTANRSLRLAYGELSYFLPSGFSILIDPATVSFRYVNLSADYSLGKDWHINSRYTASTRLGAGLSAYHARTAINSALIDTSSSVNGLEPFVFLAGGLRRKVPTGALVLDASVHRYSNEAFEFKASLGFEF